MAKKENKEIKEEKTATPDYQGEARQKGWFSKPLFRQSVKSNLGLWLALTIGSAAIFVVINLVVGTKTVFSNIDMNKVLVYIQDENMNFLKILGLLESMGFSLSRIQTMSQLDLNSIMNDLVYKIAGVLLPMVYVMITCNKLLAAQVNDGSMAYILSTPTNRKKVVKTQYFFISMSLILMYLVISIAAFGSGAVAWVINPPSNINFLTMTLRTFLYCFASLCAMFCLTGVCFGASAWFNKSSNSIALGGGACILAFLCCILGLFGNKVFVSVGVGVQAMDFFNYLTIYTLVDTESLGNFAKAASGIKSAEISYKWAWELAVLLGSGFILAFIGSFRFVKKDLPL